MTTHGDYHEPRPIGTIITGGVLIVLGALWLLDLSGVVSLGWTAVGAIVLIAVGVGLMLGARNGVHGGLLTIGIILSALLVVTAFASLPRFGSGIGDRDVSPVTQDDLADGYDWAVGTQTVDLRDAPLDDGVNEVRVRVGMGEAVVLLPEDVPVRVEYEVGMGDARILGESHSGVGVRGVSQTDDYDSDTDQPALLIRISAGMGQIEVRR